MCTHTHQHRVFQSPCMPHSWVILGCLSLFNLFYRETTDTEATQHQMFQHTDLIHQFRISDLWILKKFQVGFQTKIKTSPRPRICLSGYLHWILFSSGLSLAPAWKMSPACHFLTKCWPCSTYSYMWQYGKITAVLPCVALTFTNDINDLI